MEYELIIRGNREEIERVIATLDHEVFDRSALASFVAECTRSMPTLKVLGRIATASLEQEPVSREALILEAGANEGDLNGATGNIGKAWAKHFSAPNPFKGLPTPSGYVYRVPTDLAVDVHMLIGQRLLEAAPRA